MGSEAVAAARTFILQVQIIAEQKYYTFIWILKRIVGIYNAGAQKCYLRTYTYLHVFMYFFVMNTLMPTKILFYQNNNNR